MGALIVAALLAGAPGQGHDPVRDLRSCSTTPQDQRLSCYEKAAAALLSAIDRHDLAVVDGAMLPPARHAPRAFGMRKSSGADETERGGPRATAIRELHDVARSVREVTAGRFEIALENGGVWKNVEPFRVPPEPGQKITILGGAMGSFFMTIGDSKLGTRCARAR